MLKLDRVGLAGVLVRIEGNRLSGILLADTEEILNDHQNSSVVLNSGRRRQFGGPDKGFGKDGTLNWESKARVARRMPLPNPSNRRGPPCFLINSGRRSICQFDRFGREEKLRVWLALYRVESCFACYSTSTGC